VEEIHVLLKRVEYPASREDLIDAAVAGDLTFASVARLQNLEGRRYESADDVSEDLFGRRAESNPSVIAITAEPCERCGFPRTAGEPHSCIEEKALFAESVNAVTGTFERFDESTARQAVSEDLRSGVDRRQSGTRVGPIEERRHPVARADGGPVADNGGERRDVRPDAG
jgi:hypothetical protein